jgi:hypothetical protein
LLIQFWPHLVAALHIIVACIASARVVLLKPDPRAAIGWVGIIWLTPLLAFALYVMTFGVNRVRRRAIERRPIGAISELVVMPTDSHSATIQKSSASLLR